MRPSLSFYRILLSSFLQFFMAHGLQERFIARPPLTLDFLNIHGVVIGWFKSSDIPAERTSSYGNIEDWDMSGVVALNCLFTSECPDKTKD
jgi:hypothetical protein